MLRVYKPRPEAYRCAADLLACPPGEILMVACHNFDLDATRGEGYRTGFVRRPDEWGQAARPIRCQTRLATSWLPGSQNLPMLSKPEGPRL
jgi:FMN phosphatase YigB (HAD superfamily)